MNIHINRITNKISGAEMYTIYLIQSLQKVRHINIAVSTDNKDLFQRVKNLGVKTQLINPGIEEIGTKKQFLKALPKVRRYFLNYTTLFKNTNDIIMFESMTEKLFLTKYLSKKHKVIWIEHGPLFSTQRALIIKHLYKLSSSYVNAIVAVSKNTEKDLITNGIAKHKVKTIYIAKTDTKSPIKKAQISIPSHHKVVGFIGSINRAKGIYHFITYAKKLMEKDKQFVFFVLGEGEELDAAKAYAAELNLSQNIIFTGFVDTTMYLPLIDVLVFPSEHSEGISMALLEAIHAGVPVVASDAGGNKEIIIDGYNGYICSSFDTNIYIKAIKRALEQRSTLSGNAKKLVLDKFNSDKMTKEFIKLFEG